MVDASKKKEMKAKETIRQLDMEREKMSSLLVKGAGLSLEHESTISALTKTRDELQIRLADSKEENQRQLDSIQKLQEQIETQREKIKKNNETIASLEDNLSDSAKAEKREQRRKERMEKELRDVREKLDVKTEAHKHVETQFEEMEYKKKNLDIRLKDAQGKIEKHKRDLKSAMEKLQTLHLEKDEQIRKNQALRVENQRVEQELLNRDREINKTRDEKEKLRRKLGYEKKKVGRLENFRAEEKMERDMLQEQINHLNKEIVTLKKDIESKHKAINELHRANDVTEKSLRRAEELSREHAEKVGIGERANRRLQGELLSCEKDVQKQETMVHKLEKERERVGLEASELSNKYMSQIEKTKIKERLLKETQKQIMDLKHKLKAQQQLYESVRADRNLYSKNLIESQDQIAEMKKKFKIMNHQIEQLKEEIVAKDRSIVKEHFGYQKVEKQREQLKNELGRTKQIKNKAETTIEKQHTEISKLTSIIAKLEEDAVLQHKEYDQVINERDILGTQLIRRNDELALLYEKIKIQQSTLRKGEAQFSDRVQDIRLLKIELQDMMRKLRIATEKTAHIPKLKRELYNTQRELLTERTKNKGMSDELVNPMNVHRWRKLAGTDPHSHEMIQKIHMLQKRLISKTEEVVSKDLQIKEKEKRFEELKIALSRQPGPEVANQLIAYQSHLKEKARQMKAMKSELNMYQAQENEFKHEIERLVHELNGMKRKYYRQKQMKMSQNQRDAGREIVLHDTEQARAQRKISQEARKRLVGGGFAVK